MECGGQTAKIDEEFERTFNYEIQNNEKTRFEIECVGKANDLFSFVFEVSNCDEEESYDIEIEYINGENVFKSTFKRCKHCKYFCNI